MLLGDPNSDLRGEVLDILNDDRVFAVQRGEGGALGFYERCSEYFGSTLTVAQVLKLSDELRAHALGVAAAPAVLPKCTCGQPWVLNTVHRANTPCYRAADPADGLGPSAPKGPCTVCGKPQSEHGSYPTCATHPYTPGGNCQHVLGAACVGAECRNGCVRARDVNACRRGEQ